MKFPLNLGECQGTSQQWAVDSGQSSVGSRQSSVEKLID